MSDESWGLSITKLSHGFFILLDFLKEAQMGGEIADEAVEFNRMGASMNLGSQVHQGSSPCGAKLNLYKTFVKYKSSFHEEFKY